MKSKLKFTAIVLILASNAAFAANTDEIRLLEPQSIFLQAQAVFPSFPPVLKPSTSKEPDVVVLTSGAHFYKQAITSTKPQITGSEKFEPLKGAKTVIKIPPGKAVLVNVAFTAESRCTEPDSNAGNWCEVSIRVNNQEAHPKASSFPSDTYAFDSTDSGSETGYSWESHAMDRHLCIRNTTSTVKSVPVDVFWKVTNFDAGIAPSFWLDDWSLTVQLARGCKQSNQKF